MRKSIVLLFVTASLLGSHSCRKPSVQEEEKTVFPEAVGDQTHRQAVPADDKECFHCFFHVNPSFLF